MAEASFKISSKTAWTVIIGSDCYKILLYFRSLDHLSRNSLCLSDDSKLLRKVHLIKRRKGDLSTFRDIPCGREWISQRFVAKLPVALGQQPQTQRVELNKAFRILLVIRAGIVLKRDVLLAIQAVG